jgi:hypothetical protein
MEKATIRCSASKLKKSNSPKMTMIMAPPSQHPPPKSSPSTSDTSAAWHNSMNIFDRTSHSIEYHSCQSRSVSSLLQLRFDPQVRVRYVPNLDDLTPQEQLDTWYSTEDYKYIRRREHSLMRKLSRQVHVSQKNEPKHFCSRVSLEQRVLGLQTRKEHDDRCQHIREVQFLVLDEQERHGDPGKLAQAYSQITLESAQQARDRGLNVEIVLRNLELSSDSSHHRGRSESVGNSAYSFCSDMKHRRWFADPTSSSSSLSPVRDNTTTTVHRPGFAFEGIVDPDVPLSLSMKRHILRRHDKKGHHPF